MLFTFISSSIIIIVVSSPLFYESCFTYNYTHLHALEVAAADEALIFARLPLLRSSRAISTFPSIHLRSLYTGPSERTHHHLTENQRNLIGIQSFMISSLFRFFFPSTSVVARFHKIKEKLFFLTLRKDFESSASFNART